jgi:hypothetical protein
VTPLVYPGLPSQRALRTFDKAWQEAVARNLMRMAENDRFCRCKKLKSDKFI